MLICLPKSICDRNYRVRGLPEGEAEVDFDFIGEHGTIQFAGETLRVRKQGLASGRWTLERAGEVLAEAIKPSAMSRNLDIHTLGVVLNLKAKSALSYEFILSHEGEPCGRIRPMHMWTRRAHVECNGSIDSITQLFAFWLVALIWRRSDAAAAS